MMSPREFWQRLRTWSQRDRLDAEVASELRVHVELLARDLEKDGLSRQEALASARRQIGNTTSQRESSRDAWGFPGIDVLLQDIRYSIRGLRRTPVFTVTAVLTLGLGIGANAAMFAVIDELMFRPVPFLADQDRTGRVYTQISREGKRVSSLTMPYTRYLDLKEANRSFSTISAISEWRLAIGTGADTRVRKVAGVSGEMWQLFDARPALGRFFGPAEDRIPEGSSVAVLSYAYWQSAFGGRDVIGERLRIGARDATIVGVAPEGFEGATSGRPIEIYLPVTAIPFAMTVDPDSRANYYRDYRWDFVEVLARRRPEVSEAVANAELTEAYRRSRGKARLLNPNVMPDSLARPTALTASMRTAAGPDLGREGRILLWVSGVAAIVLIIACANVANLMLARILRRQREIALRLALGVGRARLAGQFIVEALTLAFMGAAAGLIAAQWTASGVRSLLLPFAAPMNIITDSRTIMAVAGVAIAAALLTVAAPLILAMKSELSSALKAGARDGGYRSSWLRSALLVVQGGLSVALLVGAGLFVRSLDNVRQIPLGFDVSTVIDVFPDFRGDVHDSASRVAHRRHMLTVAQSIPGVEAATRINSPLFSTNTTFLRVPGIDSVEKLGRFAFQFVTPDFFKVMRTRILRGRGFDQRDGEGAARSVIVSASMARVLWPNEEALGKCIQVAFGPTAPNGIAECTTVVGIAEDVARIGIVDTARYSYYLPVDQVNPTWGSTIYVRLANGGIDVGIERVRAAMQAEMPGNGFVVVTPVQKRVDDQQRGWRLGATLFLAFGGLALIVAAIGLYGVTAYNVAQRMHELGVRVALGAGRRDIVGLVVRDAFVVTIAGVGIGLSVALAVSGWLQPLLYEQSARDPVTYFSIGFIMLLVAVTASAIPAARAASVDPNRALRAE
jgi:putative ABC transport system permease protein